MCWDKVNVCARALYPIESKSVSEESTERELVKTVLAVGLQYYLLLIMVSPQPPLCLHYPALRLDLELLLKTLL